eukprot:g39400.t1
MAKGVEFKRKTGFNGNDEENFLLFGVMPGTKENGGDCWSTRGKSWRSGRCLHQVPRAMIPRAAHGLRVPERHEQRALEQRVGCESQNGMSSEPWSSTWAASPRTARGSSSRAAH